MRKRKRGRERYKRKTEGASERGEVREVGRKNKLDRKKGYGKRDYMGRGMNGSTASCFPLLFVVTCSYCNALVY